MCEECEALKKRIADLEDSYHRVAKAADELNDQKRTLIRENNQFENRINLYERIFELICNLRDV